MTKKIYVGNVPVGGDSKVTIQSMTNTDTKDISSTISQIKELEEAGCELIRSAINDEEDAKAIREIKKSINIPFIADIQFDYKLAIYAAENGADCIRINPGNIGSKVKTKKVVEVCKDKNIPIRIGVNSGSISQKIIDKYHGVNENSLVASAMEELDYLEALNFYNSKVSIKSSDVLTNIKANEQFAKISDYPIHLGVTESGTLKRGTVKSSIGIGNLLYQGIGDTIRVSLSANPVEEIEIAKLILQALDLRTFNVEIVSCPTCSRTSIDLIKLTNELEDRIDQINKNVKIAVMGCVVNGPGEAKEADYGITASKGQGLIFKKGKVVERVKEEKLLDNLIELINSD